MILELEHSGVWYVCQGGAMMVTCSTSADVLRWNVTVPLSQTQRVFERRLPHFSAIQIVTPIMTALTTLNVSKLLNNSWPLPLVSTISTNNATADLNGTTMTCSAASRMNREFLASASAEILLVGNSGNIGNSRCTCMYQICR